MKSFQELIAKLSKMNFIKNEKDVLIADNLIGVGYSFTTDSGRTLVVIQITLNGYHVMTWGCENWDDSQAFLGHYMKWRNDAEEAEHQQREYYKKAGLETLNRY